MVLSKRKETRMILYCVVFVFNYYELRLILKLQITASFPCTGPQTAAPKEPKHGLFTLLKYDFNNIWR